MEFYEVNVCQLFLRERMSCEKVLGLQVLMEIEEKAELILEERGGYFH